MLLLAVPLAVMLLPGVATAHSDLVSSDPVQGAVVPSPYSGPIVLTFSEHLSSGSMADLVDSAGATLAKAVVDPAAKTMTFTLTSPLAPGAWLHLVQGGSLAAATVRRRDSGLGTRRPRSRRLLVTPLFSGYRRDARAPRRPKARPVPHIRARGRTAARSRRAT